MTSLNNSNSAKKIPPIYDLTLSQSEICSTETNYTFRFGYEGYYCYYPRERYFVVFQAESNNFLPLIRSEKSSAIFMDVGRALYDLFAPTQDEEQYITTFNLSQVNRLFIETIPPITINTTLPNKSKIIFQPTIFTISEFMKDAVQFRIWRFDIPNEKSLDAGFRSLITIEIKAPKFNQYDQCYNSETLPNLPKGIRQLAISTYSQLSVNKTFRGRQTPHIPGVYMFIESLRKEFQSSLIEIILTSAFNSQQVIVFRVDLSNKTSETFLYVLTPDDSPLYATLRFPPAMLEILSVQSVYGGAQQAFTDVSEFESNVIYANAAMAAGMIGGGLLSGLGQGISQYAQSKLAMQMQDRTLSWYERKQLMDIDNQKYLQQSMFDFKSHQQNKDIEYGYETQRRNIDWQRASQAAAYSQQNYYQNTQNQFTKELVETNLDSDIRRARNAQQLAGYRTDAAVSGLSNNQGRGGLGHPDAPRGVMLPPRSASTQTNSPRVYTTRPTGYYTGPMTNNDNDI